jgi:hypothetical protein
MAKSNGLGDNFYYGGYDLSGDINSLSNIGGGPATLDVTGIDKSAVERIGGLRDGRIEFTSYFNASANQAHSVLNDLPTTDLIVSYLRGTTQGNPMASLNAKQINYDPTRGDDGDLKCAVSAQANSYGLEWGFQLTSGLDNVTAAATGTAYNTGASGTFGLQAYMHVTAFTGTSATVTLQHSNDNGVGDPWAAITGGAFAAASAIGAQRIATANNLTVKQYIRLVVSGTFSNFTFAVNVVKNSTTVVF